MKIWFFVLVCLLAAGCASSAIVNKKYGEEKIKTTARYKITYKQYLLDKKEIGEPDEPRHDNIFAAFGYFISLTAYKIADAVTEKNKWFLVGEASFYANAYVTVTAIEEKDRIYLYLSEDKTYVEEMCFSNDKISDAKRRCIGELIIRPQTEAGKKFSLMSLPVGEWTKNASCRYLGKYTIKTIDKN